MALQLSCQICRDILRSTVAGRARGALAFLIWSVLLAISVAVADAPAETPVFRDAPNPKKLADILYPPRYRAIVLTSARAEAPPPAFGLMVNFEFDSTVILPEAAPLLAAVGDMLRLKKMRDRSVLIEGHTDATGTEEYNLQLSERRARAVKRYLVDHYGVDPSRLTTKGVGERSLHDRSNPRGGINRRVQFRAVGDGHG